MPYCTFGGDIQKNKLHFVVNALVDTLEGCCFDFVRTAGQVYDGTQGPTLLVGWYAD